MKQRYRMLQDVPTRKRLLLKGHVYTIDAIFGEQLLGETLAEPYVPVNNKVMFTRADGQKIECTKKEYKALTQLNKKEVQK